MRLKEFIFTAFNRQNVPDSLPFYRPEKYPKSPDYILINEYICAFPTD